MIKTLLLGLLLAIPTYAQKVSIRAKVDRPQISMEESVSLKVTIEVGQGFGGFFPDVEFDAPGFTQVQSYQSQSMKSFYSNGQIEVTNSLDITKVLRPDKKGTLKISNIRINVNGKIYKAKDQVVKVSGSLAPSGPAARGARGQPGSNRRGSDGLPENQFFMKAIVSKSDVFKGEQIIVDYYLYRRGPAFNAEVTKFPVLQGFLKENIKVVPMVRQPQREVVTENGVTYRRTLVTSYAAYPLKSGELEIDPITVRFSYYPKHQGSRGFSDDPFFNFFQQMNPQRAVRKSRPIKVKVSELPADGRPDNFAGAVGNFDLTAAVDKYSVAANDAVTLKIAVIGEGNVRSLEKLEIDLPISVDTYESKEDVQISPGGKGRKLFEYLLVPRQPGKIELAGLELPYFDPTTQTYKVVRSEPITVNVLDPKPGTELVQSQKQKELALKEEQKSLLGSPEEPSPQAPKEIAYIRAPDVASFWQWTRAGFWKWTALWLYLGLIGLGTGLGFVELRRRRGPRKPKKKGFDEFEKRLSASQNIYKDGPQVLFDALSAVYPVRAHTLTRSELKDVLVGEGHLNQPLFEQIEKILEHCDVQVFSGGGGAQSQDSQETTSRIRAVLTQIKKSKK